MCGGLVVMVRHLLVHVALDVPPPCTAMMFCCHDVLLYLGCSVGQVGCSAPPQCSVYQGVWVTDC